MCIKYTVCYCCGRFHFSVALLQLALWDQVFLLDVPALLVELTDDDWRLLATGFFNNETVLKLGTIQLILSVLFVRINYYRPQTKFGAR